LAMEGRLRRLALGAVLRTLAGNHALAQQHPGAAHCAFLDEIVVLHHQNFANVVGMIEEDDVVPSDFVVRNVAVVVGEVLEKKNRIGGPKSAEGKQEKIALKAGWEAVGRSSGCGRANLVCGWS